MGLNMRIWKQNERLNHLITDEGSDDMPVHSNAVCLK